MRIGTSGWHYGHWRGPFYPPGLPVSRWLDYYAQHFDSVEVNNSFYHLLAPATVSEWYRDVPDHFLFAVKGSRYITHNKKLSDPKESLARFFAPVRRFRDKLGPIVFQLPPRWGCNAERLRLFLRALPKTRRFAFEFRDASWHNDEVYELLARANAAFCIFEIAGFCSPLVASADFVYVRLHGPGAKYEGDYPRRTLNQWAARIRAWTQERKDVHLYFDNDQAGYAAKNALTIRDLIA